LFQHENKVPTLDANKELLVAGETDQILRTYRFGSSMRLPIENHVDYGLL
jgi:hypothetical protein